MEIDSVQTIAEVLSGLRCVCNLVAKQYDSSAFRGQVSAEWDIGQPNTGTRRNISAVEF